jgi:hypothetical protein
MDAKRLCLQGFSGMTPLPDASYDVVVVDVEIDEHDELHIEVVITLGPQIGRIVRLKKLHVDTRRGRLSTDDPHSLLGIAGTLRVRNGVPIFRPETA